ncbi:trimeric intracellular cation channel family protein [Reichenbachiella agarivorans]|uniref:Trimeric intracellular cation channel family protein n=1 Tax=Reichenbachiella agarivorans TaxID=2979464 RepID=A0ABY6CR90_9BACT|nr:trimeric intracellular cation channel family protein [Reichenbachiella agarivorans]UXP33016.1 trimeric intracellular cation channel family protein [Reichenbachiella agarivorans]
MLELIYILNLVGTVVFAISGALTASDHKMDAFGAVVIAFITALGGGTVRDLLLDSHPIGWMGDPNYLYAVLFAVLLSYLFKRWIASLRRTMFLFDTIGIGLFAALGTQKALGFDMHFTIAIMMGVVSSVFGGVLRDILTNRVPLIFRKEIYATACLAGASLYVILIQFPIPDYLTLIIPIVLTMIIRLLAVKFEWSLPGIK